LRLGEYHGWLVLAHPHFEDQYSRWYNQVVELRRRDPEGYINAEATKRFAALDRLVFELIPQNPMDDRYLLGNTLGAENRNWRRAKFGGQYRLFFRFDSINKIIILGWVNFSDSLRAYGSKNDAYLLFTKLLANGNPPSRWDELLEQSL
jgi:toxin YhaV